MAELTVQSPQAGRQKKAFLNPLINVNTQLMPLVALLLTNLIRPLQVDYIDNMIFSWRNFVHNTSTIFISPQSEPSFPPHLQLKTTLEPSLGLSIAHRLTLGPVEFLRPNQQSRSCCLPVEGQVKGADVVLQAWGEFGEAPRGAVHHAVSPATGAH